MVPREIGRDGEEPGPEGTVTGIGGLTEQPDERFLSEVLRRRPIAGQHPKEEAEQLGVVAENEGLEGSTVTLADRSHDFFITPVHPLWIRQPAAEGSHADLLLAAISPSDCDLSFIYADGK